MLPIGPLMKEHRTIERMVALISQEAQRLREDDAAEPDAELSRAAVDFMRNYADRAHHGKEEDILFEALQGRDIPDEHANTLEGLLDDHVRGRELVRMLEDATDRHESGDGDARGEIVEALEALGELYPRHIATEDREFFIPVMEHFDEDEQRDMMDDMWEFDRGLYAEPYEQVVEHFRDGP